MFLHLYLFYNSKSLENKEDAYAFRWKLRYTISFNLLFVIGGILYIWHNVYCTPYVYTLYAMAEWGIVFSNILFNYGIVHDFHESYPFVIYVGKNYLSKDRSTL